MRPGTDHPDQMLRGVALGLGITVLGAALVFATCQVVHAQEVDEEELADAAARAGVDVEDLRGAAYSTRTHPLEYLYSVNELARPTVLPPATAPPGGGIWDALAQCESGGNWAANTGNGYFGGIQFDRPSWLAAGGGKYATRADYATRAQQIEIGQVWQSMGGWGKWPACSRRLGLR